MPQAFLEVGPELIAAMVAFISSPQARFNLEVENALPPDSKFVRHDFRYTGGDVIPVAVIESKYLREGETLPVPIIRQRVVKGGVE